MKAAQPGRLPRTARPVEFVVDPSMYERGPEVEPTDGLHGVGSVGRLDLRHHFIGPTCAEYWMALCQAPEYGHRKLIELIDASCPAMLYPIKANGTPVTLVSLGPGDGELDLMLLRHLEARLNLDCYCCVDFSFDLLRHAVRRVSCTPELTTSFPIRAVCGDFTRLVSSPGAQDGTSNLFALTGYTLGNYSEGDLLGRVRALMKPRDWLLVDARLHDLRGYDGNRAIEDDERERLTRAYALPLSNRFAFGPVEIATTATPADVAFGYDVCRRVTVVPNALNVVTFCTGLKTTLRVTGEPVERARLDLGSTTLYRLEDLLGWFEVVHLTPCWHIAEDSTALFLLKRAATPRPLAR